MREKSAISWANRPAWIGIAANLFLGAAGCATRGFVRSQMTDLKAEMGRADTDLRSGIDEARSAADDAGTKATDAALESETTRLLALGRVGYREMERYRVYFRFNDAEPTHEDDGTLGRVAEEVNAHPEYIVEIYGYTDATGSDLYNLELAHTRAESIRRRLVGQVPGQLSRFHAIGFGEHAPPGEVATLGDGAERRQVVIVLAERTAPLVTTKPFAERQDGPR